ncbi:M14 family metallocarboxypeptidase [Peribacillus acanthi]|uniref:M14 family metallocarboxypeptidase n=1 Tax=Peribacillus acanthi TaxID=2171554 RepID=UPI000D3E5C26|nr:M14 family metallocarboxypeptidase [Peribacillus acanthi]
MKFIRLLIVMCILFGTAFAFPGVLKAEGNTEVSPTEGETPVVTEEPVALTHFKITSEVANFYIRKNERLTAIAQLTVGEEFKFVEEMENWFVVEVGGMNAFVKKTDAAASDGSTISNPAETTTPVKSFDILQDVFVYTDESFAKAILTLVKGESYQVIEENEASLTLSIGGRKGFVKKADLQQEFTASDRYFKILVPAQPVFVKQSGVLVQKGTLLQNQEFIRLRGEGAWHVIRYGNDVAYVKMEGTAPSSGATLKQATGATSKVMLTTTTALSIYNGPSLQNSAIATMPANVSYPILSRQGEWYVINYGGRVAYVHPKQAKTNFFDAVNSKVTYTYEQMIVDIRELQIMYPTIVKTEILGKSVDGRNLYAVKLGTGTKEVMLNGSHHAREHMTTNVLMEMLDSYALSFVKGTTYGGYNTRQVLTKTSIWFIPMLNPDGVSLVQKGHKSAKNPSYVLKINGGKTDFSAWKANIRGVDLNRQYPPNWSKVEGPKGPAPKNFKGYKPLSEPEALALVNFTRKHSFKTTAAYHSSGEILYWYYGQKGAQYTRDLGIANRIKLLTGYSLVPAKVSMTSGGGFKDWFITEFKQPGFTPEIAPYVGERPVPNYYFPSVWKKNYKVGLMLASEASNR